METETELRSGWAPARTISAGAIAVALAFGDSGAGARVAQQVPQQEPRPTFRAGVARVTLAVIVRDARGRPITGLTDKDFTVLDAGEPVAVSDFRSDDQPISVALLVDTSGSMRLGDRMGRARAAAEQLVGGLRTGEDEAALFTFDLNLHEAAPFTPNLALIPAAVTKLAPYGSTALHDAVAATARRSVERPQSRRAVIVITDGIDTSSELSAAQASSIASSIDVPVYILGVDATAATIEQLDDEKRPTPLEWTGRLDYLARWSGGAFLPAATPALTKLAANEIVSDLRSGYLMAFAPRNLPGWHELSVKVSRANAKVRTRGGFWVGPK